MLRIDARIPVRFGAASGAKEGEAVLVEPGPVPAGRCGVAFVAGETGHVGGCACCVGRSPAAVALAALFQMRARGGISFFRAVVADVGAAGEGEVRAAMEADALVSAWFRMA